MLLPRTDFKRILISQWSIQFYKMLTVFLVALKIQFNSIFSFVCFVCRFRSLLPFDSAVKLEELPQEFKDYLLIDESEFNLGCKDRQVCSVEPTSRWPAKVPE